MSIDLVTSSLACWTQYRTKTKEEKLSFLEMVFTFFFTLYLWSLQTSEKKNLLQITELQPKKKNPTKRLVPPSTDLQWYKHHLTEEKCFPVRLERTKMERLWNVPFDSGISVQADHFASWHLLQEASKHTMRYSMSRCFQTMQVHQKLAVLLYHG